MRSLVYKSNSLKFWLSFFQKGVYALQTILCCKALDKEIYFLLKPFFYFLIFVDQGFGYHNGNGGFLRYNLSHFFCLCHQFFIFHHPVDKPDGCCLFCIIEIEAHLTSISMGKFAKFQIYNHKATQTAMEEK